MNWGSKATLKHLSKLNITGYEVLTKSISFVNESVSLLPHTFYLVEFLL
jgi:hypothetical protein